MDEKGLAYRSACGDVHRIWTLADLGRVVRGPDGVPLLAVAFAVGSGPSMLRAGFAAALARAFERHAEWFCGVTAQVRADSLAFVEVYREVARGRPGRGGVDGEDGEDGEDGAAGRRRADGSVPIVAIPAAEVLRRHVELARLSRSIDRAGPGAQPS